MDTHGVDVEILNSKNAKIQILGFKHQTINMNLHQEYFRCTTYILSSVVGTRLYIEKLGA